MQVLVRDEVAAIRDEIAVKLGTKKFNIWFGHSTRIKLTDDYLNVSVPNSFIASWIENHFSQELSDAVRAVTGFTPNITFSIDPELTARQKTADVKDDTAAVEKPVIKASLALSKVRKAPKPKHLKLALADFVVGPSNKLAFNAARAVSENPENLFNPLFLHGSYGIGKTHLLQGVCNSVLAKDPSAKCIYVSAEEFTNQYVMALKSGKLESFRKKFRQADVLAIDDIHFLANKKSTQEEFLHTFNTIDLANKQVVLASDAHPKMIGQLTESLVSRFVSGMVVKVDAPDYETRLAICRKKAKQMSTEISDDIICYLAKHVKRSVRELEGALLKISAFLKISGQKLDLQTVRPLLSDALSSGSVNIQVDDIEEVVVDYFETTIEMLHSSSKDRTVSLARSIAMYLVRNYTNLSYPEIGRLMGNKNHATVIQANKKVNKLLDSHSEISWKTSIGRTTKNIDAVIRTLSETVEKMS